MEILEEGSIQNKTGQALYNAKQRVPTAHGQTSSSFISILFHFYMQIVYLITYHHKRWLLNINYFISFVYTFIAPQFTLHQDQNTNEATGKSFFFALQFYLIRGEFDVLSD